MKHMNTFNYTEGKCTLLNKAIARQAAELEMLHSQEETVPLVFPGEILAFI